MDVGYETITVQTEYGDTEMKVVECDSCGQTIAKDNAEPFQIGGNEMSAKDGWVCTLCHDNPVSYPDGSDKRDNNTDTDERIHREDRASPPIKCGHTVSKILPYVFIIITFPFLFLITVLHNNISNRNDVWAAGYYMGAVSGILWTTLFALLLL